MRSLPSGVICIAVSALILCALLPFRMPPMSKSASNDFYKLDIVNCNEDQGKIEHINADFGVNDKEISVNADVKSSVRIPVYNAVKSAPNIDKIVKAFGIDDSFVETKESMVSYSYAFFEVGLIERAYANATLITTDNGELELYVFNSGIDHITEEFVKTVVKNSGLIADDAEIEYIAPQDIWVARPLIGDIALAADGSWSCFDEKPQFGYGITFSLSEGTLTVIGNTLSEFKLVWKETRIVSPDAALSALSRKIGYCASVTQPIRLVYNGKIEKGDPYNVLLYPAWEILLDGEYGQTTLVNAVTGEVERYMKQYIKQ